MTDSKEVLRVAHKSIDDKFGKDIVVLDIGAQSVLADYFIIATANNTTQVRAIADDVQEKLHMAGVKLRHSEGYNSSRWILLDFGILVVHIFMKEDREFYRLEKIWGDSRVILADELFEK